MSSGVNVVVVTHDSATELAGLVASLGDGLGDVPCDQVVVVDSGSRDDTVAVARALELTVVELGGNLGYAAGINAGLQALDGAGPVLVCNPDLRLRPAAVPALLEALEPAGVGIAVPRVVDAQGDLQPSLRRWPTLPRALGEALLGGRRAGRSAWLGERVLNPRAYTTPRRADWATGCALLVSRACLAAVGPWDESYVLYSEEVDFSLRAHDAGFVVAYTPHAEVVHRGGDGPRSPALWSLMAVNRVALYRSRHGRAAGLAYRAVVTLGEALRALTGSERSRRAVRALLSPDLGGARGRVVAELA